jgi:hypothetical protein
LASVTFRVVFAAGAAAQYHNLPPAAQESLVYRAVDLADAPWDASVLPPGNLASFREAILGDGRGLVDFYIDDEAETIRIFNPVWIG